MSRYKLIIDPDQVTLLDTETGRQESAATNGNQLFTFRLRCTMAGIDLETVDRR